MCAHRLVCIPIVPQPHWSSIFHLIILNSFYHLPIEGISTIVHQSFLRPPSFSQCRTQVSLRDPQLSAVNSDNGCRHWFPSSAWLLPNWDQARVALCASLPNGPFAHSGNDIPGQKIPGSVASGSRSGELGKPF